MKRKQAEQVGNVLSAWLRSEGLETPLAEYRALQAWDNFSPYIKNNTRERYIRNQTLFVRIDGAALRQELLMLRTDIVQRINSEAGAQVITDFRLL